MNKIIAGLMLCLFGSYSQTVFAYDQCEGSWEDRGYTIRFHRKAFKCVQAVEVRIKPHESAHNILRFADQVELFSAESQQPNGNLNGRYAFPATTFQGSPREMYGKLKINITALQPIPGRMYNGHQVFYAMANPNANPDVRDNLGIIFDAKIGTSGGNVTGGWIPITQTSQEIRGFHWENHNIEYYGADLKATYILLNPSAIRTKTFRFDGQGKIGEAELLSDDTTITVETAANKRTNILLEGVNFTINPKKLTCKVEGQKDISVQLPTIKKTDLKQIGTDSTEFKSFDLNVKCDASDNQYPKLYVTFTDLSQGAKNNGSQELLNTTQSNNYAKGVSLRFRNANTNEVVKFGPDKSTKGNLGQFPLPLDNNGNSRNRFNVYYVNNGTGPNGEVSAGDVLGIAAYTFSYQ